MSNKSILIESAHDYLKAVAKTVESQIGSNPRYTQHSTWMVKTGPTSMSSKPFTREAFDIFRASTVYQLKILHTNPQHQQRLIEALVGAGIERQHVHYGFLSPLVHHWLELEKPFAFDEKQINKLLGEFSAAVLEGLITIKSSDAILQLGLETESVSLEKGITIRPISISELWEHGSISDFKQFSPRPGPQWDLVGEHWNILEIEIRRKRAPVHPPEDIQSVRETVLTALTLVSPGHLQIYDLGTRANFGMGSTGTVRIGAGTPKEIGRWGGRFILNKESAQSLKELWPHLRKIIKSKSHYLRIPAQRLVYGGGRFREDDAIIDNAIGLEALLLKNINAELSYRFALRGATILAWNHGVKEEFFTQLQDFYNIRSKIVHGGQQESAKLRDARSNGEKALREIWWWFFINGEDLSQALAKVDNAILR